MVVFTHNSAVAFIGIKEIIPRPAFSSEVIKIPFAYFFHDVFLDFLEKGFYIDEGWP